MDRMKGKAALVTGAAKGLGEATAAMLAREGARVMLTDVDEKAGKAAAERIGKEGHEAVFLKHDVSSEQDWKRVMDETMRRFAQLDALVNNAGVAIGKDVERTTLDEWRWLMSINLDGVFLGTRFAIEAMKPARRGSIINLSSIEGLVGDPNLAAYNASKGGVRLFTKSAALHCAKAGYNIRVNSVHPGYIVTPMVEGYAEASGDAAATRRALEALHPLGHLGEPNDIAYGVLYLASDESKFMTGAELVIDGGYTAQ
jgi:NAD(P)-dependent dehydrogenase (short-subunit alcohol dehydrogenase family)